MTLNHSGAFDLGAATVVVLVPSEKLGIVVLTNGAPIGVPEAVSADFLDLRAVRQGLRGLARLRRRGRREAMNAAGHFEDRLLPPTRQRHPGPEPVRLHRNLRQPLLRPDDRRRLRELAGHAPRSPKPCSSPSSTTTATPSATRRQGENAAGLSGVTFARTALAVGVARRCRALESQRDSVQADAGPEGMDGADPTEDDGVVAGRMLLADVADEYGECVGQHRDAVVRRQCSHAGEAVARPGETTASSPSWCPRTFTAKEPRSRAAAQAREDTAGQNSTRGGARDAEVSELTVIPTGFPERLRP